MRSSRTNRRIKRRFPPCSQAAAFLNQKKQETYNAKLVALRGAALRALAPLCGDPPLLRAEAFAKTVNGRSAPLVSNIVAILRSLREQAPVRPTATEIVDNTIRSTVRTRRGR